MHQVYIKGWYIHHPLVYIKHHQASANLKMAGKPYILLNTCIPSVSCSVWLTERQNYKLFLLLNSSMINDRSRCLQRRLVLSQRSLTPNHGDILELGSCSDIEWRTEIAADLLLHNTSFKPCAHSLYLLMWYSCVYVVCVIYKYCTVPS